MTLHARAWVVADPDQAAALALSAHFPPNTLRSIGWHEFSAEALLRASVDLIVLVGLPDAAPALDRLRDFQKKKTPVTVLAVLPRTLPASEFELVCSAADDFVLWPERPEVLHHRIRRILTPTREDEADLAYENLIRDFAGLNLIGQDPVFRRISERLASCARTDFPVLITGETGSGKEVFARAIHFLSSRRNHPFIPVDCAGVPDHLLENELFGHVRGAYTDAHGEQRGMAALAEGGTLFLDEVDSFSLQAQAKLLRFLQDRHFKPLGSERYSRSDVKIVAASNRDLGRLVEEKQFRVDLFFRLDVLHMELPALRQRPLDIPLLAQHFLKVYLPPASRLSFSAAALNRLSAYHWPGNVRELINVVQRAIAFAQGREITPADLALPELAEPGVAPPAEGFRQARHETIQRFEKDYIHELLDRHDGNITHAAREAGKERRAFGRLVKKYGLARPKGQAGHA